MPIKFSFAYILLFNIVSTTFATVGTPPYEEKEIRLAFNIENRLYEFKLISVIENVLKQFLNQNNEMESLLESDYKLESADDFLFEDFYFDYNRELERQGEAVRIRRRFTNLKKYFLNIFTDGGDRCEIQYKKKYKFGANNIQSVIETRFEFRKEAHPFSQGAALPEQPCSYDNLKGFLKKGTFEGEKMTPFALFLETYQLKTWENLSPILHQRTMRKRYHLSIKGPWGWGPNSNQVFIISFDRVFLPGHYMGPVFYELELEMDRSLRFDLLEKVKAQKDDLLASYREINRIKLSKALRSDWLALGSYLSSELEKEVKLLPMKSKLKRSLELTRANK